MFWRKKDKKEKQDYPELFSDCVKKLRSERNREALEQMALLAGLVVSIPSPRQNVYEITNTLNLLDQVSWKFMEAYKHDLDVFWDDYYRRVDALEDSLSKVLNPGVGA